MLDMHEVIGSIPTVSTKQKRGACASFFVCRSRHESKHTAEICRGGIFGRAVEATHGKLGSGTLEIFDTARESIGVQQLFFMDPFAVQPSVGASGDSDHIARGFKFGSDQEKLALLGGVHPTAVGNTPGIPDRFVRTEELNGLRDQVGEVIRKLGGYDQVIL